MHQDERPYAYIYAIWDKLAKAIQGHVFMARAAQPAIRLFTDIANAKDGIIAQHIEDYDLIQLGQVFTSDTANAARIEPCYDTILTGTDWAAAQRTPSPQLVKDA